MLAQRRIQMNNVLVWGGLTAGRVVLWALAVYSVYAFGEFEWMRLPFTPLSVMGIAVSFYAGFKNNSAYDRFWEGRKIWGGVVNESRSWANSVLSYILPGDGSDEAHAIRKDLIYRHLAWVNALRLQLRQTSRFHDKPARQTRIRLERHAKHMRNDWEKEITPFVEQAEYDEVTSMANSATHLVANQGRVLAKLLGENKLDLFHQIALMDILRELYALQGKAERIKKTPLPRQYAEFARIFTKVFVYSVPFGLLDVFSSSLPAAVPSLEQLPFVMTYLVAAGLVGWVFLLMEGLGDSSEDPFERSLNDVPMNSLCIVIERDLRQLLGETEGIPEPEEVIDGVLY